MTVGVLRSILALAFGASVPLVMGCTRLGTPSSTPFFEPLARDEPSAADSRLSVLWVGHATMLIQIDDKWILTDPFLVGTMGQIQRRVSPVGLDVARLPAIDAVLISHMHPDHLSLGSLEGIERRVRRLFVPEGGLVYVTDFAFDARELRSWSSFEERGLRITAVPVDHDGGRYGIDSAWMTKSFTGYVVEYHGLSVYFAGDTAYDARDFRRTREHFPHLDLALLPIAPIHPRSHMRTLHMDPDEALDALSDLGARTMIPMHFDTLVAGQDAPGEARELLVVRARARGMEDRVGLLRIGERRVVVPLLK